MIPFVHGEGSRFSFLVSRFSFLVLLSSACTVVDDYVDEGTASTKADEVTLVSAMQGILDNRADLKAALIKTVDTKYRDLVASNPTYKVARVAEPWSYTTPGNSKAADYYAFDLNVTSKIECDGVIVIHSGTYPKLLVDRRKDAGGLALLTSTQGKADYIIIQPPSGPVASATVNDFLVPNQLDLFTASSHAGHALGFLDVVEMDRLVKADKKPSPANAAATSTQTPSPAKNTPSAAQKAPLPKVCVELENHPLWATFKQE